MTFVCGLAIISLAVYAILRQVDVRLALVLAALALGAITGQAMQIVQTFLTTLTAEKFVVPICCAMGFAHVLRHTACDRHLVQLLIQPLRRLRLFLVPGAVLVGYLVNIPIISQTSTAVTVGSVLIPLLLAARISPVTAGAALLLGSSVGGELLNPGAPELGTVSSAIKQPATAIVAWVTPFNFLQLGVATAAFWVWSLRAEARGPQVQDKLRDNREPTETEPPLRISLLKAAVPMVPLGLLFLTARPFRWVVVPEAWLVKPGDEAYFDSRLIGAAMLVGVTVAAVASRQAALGTAKAFFDGAGYAFTHIISLIVTATCFGKGVELIGLADLLGEVLRAAPTLLFPAAGTLPLGFALLSGSGMAATQSLFSFFVEPAEALGVNPARLGGVVSLAAAAGRTMSPVAAVTLMCASLTQTNPLDLVRRVAVPLLLAVAAVVLAGMALPTA